VGARHCLGNEAGAGPVARRELTGDLLCAEHGAPRDKTAARVASGILGSWKMPKSRNRKRRVLLLLENTELLILLILGEILFFRMSRLDRKQ
jgi:hypothetical protein